MCCTHRMALSLSDLGLSYQGAMGGLMLHKKNRSCIVCRHSQTLPLFPEFTAAISPLALRILLSSSAIPIAQWYMPDEYTERELNG